MIKKIVLKQAPVILVELPKRSPIEMSKNGLALYCPEAIYFNKPMGIMGYLSDLTEEQFAECVDKYPDNANPTRYVNYTYKKPNGGMQVSRVTFPWCNKSSDSFYSLLESEKVYTENPLGTEPTPENTPNYAYSIHARQWEQAQQRTIDPKRTVVLLRKEETK